MVDRPTYTIVVRDEQETDSADSIRRLRELLKRLLRTGKFKCVRLEPVKSEGDDAKE